MLTLARRPARLQAQIDALFGPDRTAPKPTGYAHVNLPQVANPELEQVQALAPDWDALVARNPALKRFADGFAIEPVQACPGKLDIASQNQRLRLDLVTLDIEVRA